MYLARKYGHSSVEWKNLLGHWEKKTGPFSGFKYKVPSEEEVGQRKTCRIPPVVIAIIASQYHGPNGNRPAKQHANAVQHLAKIHPEYTEMEWKRVMKFWRLRKGMFDRAKGFWSPDMTRKQVEQLFSCESRQTAEDAPSVIGEVEPFHDSDADDVSSNGSSNSGDNSHGIRMSSRIWLFPKGPTSTLRSMGRSVG
ncbi:uncharacterized protein LOC62_07G009625 [Vanrija pseudolonga]|uniref:Uncharacterized protein n=1 Tax=Vanrija pseudolonga TaxID=143232 RepID=A0AAF0YGU3_9TREE|nr:hypothetical protein LOC62_07G009625 [Vanrija pseudolonga]